MDAREREASQSLRPSSKRPWEEDTTPRENTNFWPGTKLPPIEIVPYRRPSIANSPDHAEGGETYSRYDRPDSRDSTPKRAKFEGSAYSNVSSWEKGKTQLLTAIPIPRKSPVFNPTYSTSRAATLSCDPPLSSRSNLSEFAGSPDTSYLCRRCRRNLQDETGAVDIFDSCESCNRNSELAYITQAAAAGLTQIAETLRTGKSSEQRRNIPAHDCPPTVQFGLKSALSWILGKINQVDKLAEELAQHVPSGAVEHLERRFSTDGLTAQDSIDKMGRRWLPESEEALKKGDEALEPMSTGPGCISSVAGMVGDILPPMRSQSPYQSGMSSTMHPPPAPTRQLPSPPGRQLPSPTSLNFPSPGAPSYSSSQSTNIPPTLDQPTSGNILPSISKGVSRESTIQAHSAALQHEVSVQKIALSSLQGEHDKLLAAFSRSQTRASAFEKKHAVSDSEIISLTEDKIRLHQQVTELERDVEDLSRSRDTFREAAVQEGAQYIEIVQRASRLEEIAGEERKAWKVLKAEMERQIESLESGVDRGDGLASDIHVSVMQTAQATPPPSLETRMKIEGGMDGDVAGDLSSNIEELREEIRRLRSRCAKTEDALRAVRADTARIVGSLSTAGKEILERADGALKEEEPQPRMDE